MTSSLIKSVWFRTALTVLILVFLVARIDMRASTEALLSLDLRYLLLALLLVALDRLAMILRWIILLKTSGHKLSVKSAAWIHMVSSFVGSVLPAGLGSDVARAYTLARRNTETSEAVASVTVDRIAGILSLATMGSVGLGIWSSSDPETALVLFVSVAIGTLGLAVCTIWADSLVKHLFPRRWQASRVGKLILSTANAVAAYREYPKALFAVFLVSLIVQTLRISEAYLLSLGLGIDVSFSYFLVFMPVALLVLQLPFSIGGFGIPQGVIVWLLQPRGVPDPISFALSTLMLLTALAGSLPGAVLYLRAKR